MGTVARKTKVGKESFGAVSDGGIGLMRVLGALAEDQGKGKETSEEATGQS